MAATCRKCGAPLVWIKTPADKWMPCDEGLVPYRQNPDGKDMLVRDRGDVIRCDIVTDGSKPDGMARIPHWKTCPEADSFRRRGGKSDG